MTATMAANRAACFAHESASLHRTMTFVMAPGPAIMGMPSGVRATSPSASGCSWSTAVRVRRACSIS